jgi:hypothetical protein
MTGVFPDAFASSISVCSSAAIVPMVFPFAAVVPRWREPQRDQTSNVVSMAVA